MTHKVLETPPTNETIREKLPHRWVSIVNPENGKDVFVNIKEWRVKVSIKEFIKGITITQADHSEHNFKTASTNP